jgi:hypothetical protein
MGGASASAVAAGAGTRPARESVPFFRGFLPPTRRLSSSIPRMSKVGITAAPGSEVHRGPIETPSQGPGTRLSSPEILSGFPSDGTDILNGVAAKSPFEA